MHNTQSSLYFPTIDVLRGFAAISVVVYHVIEIFGWKEFPFSGILVWFRTGWLGVDLFFVISGFVIGLSAFSGVDKRGSSAFRLPFMIRRIVRIVPLHYLTMLYFLVFVQPEFLFENFLKNISYHLIFIHNIDIKTHGSINGANWSLGTEMQFYLLMMIFAPRLYLLRLWKVLFIFISITWCWRFSVTQFVIPDKELGVLNLFFVATQLPGMLDEFAIGIVLAKILRSEFIKSIQSYFNNPFKTSLVWLLGLVCLYLCLQLLFKVPYWDNTLMMVFYRTLIGITFGIIIFSACLTSVSENSLIRNLTYPFYYLGTISYGIYLWHLLVIVSLKRITWLTPVQALPLVIGITVLLSIISWHFFEYPLMQKYSKKS